MKLVDYLPIESEFLASCKFLAPHNQANPRCERWVVTAAQSVPSVISSEERSSLEVEARLQQTAAAAVEEDSDIDIVHFWKGIYATKRFLTLVKAETGSSNFHHFTDMEMLMLNASSAFCMI